MMEHSPDLIFLDIYLTHVNGKKLSEIIRIASESPRRKVSRRESLNTPSCENRSNAKQWMQKSGQS